MILPIFYRTLEASENFFFLYSKLFTNLFVLVDMYFILNF